MHKLLMVLKIDFFFSFYGENMTLLHSHLMSFTEQIKTKAVRFLVFEHKHTTELGTW